MWLLTLLPTAFLEFIVNTVLIVGVVSTVLSFFVLNRILLMFPPLASYYRIIQAVSLVILCAGIYFKGGYSVEQIWRERVAELEEQIKQAETATATTNRVVETKVVTKTRIIREKSKDIIQYVDREVVKNNEVIKYVENCPVPKIIIDEHNAAAVMNQAAQEPKK